MNDNKENITPQNFPPEPDSGNIEYKLKLINPTKQRLEHLVTQMKWRLEEGEGKAIYEVGVGDDGSLIGLTEIEMNESMETLYKMAGKLGATLTVLNERVLDQNKAIPKKTAEVLICKINEERPNTDLRIAVLGNVDVGKSTIIGVLTQGELDNGKGRARMNIFRHKHEFQTGRTSSVSYEVLGFSKMGTILSYETYQHAEQIIEESDKLITLIDLAGHRKYLRTTVSGLTGYSPHYIMLVVSASSRTDINTEHIDLASALEIPFFIIITKIDVVSVCISKQVVQTLKSLLKSPLYKKVPYLIYEENDMKAFKCKDMKKNTVPILMISSVSGEGLDLLTKFLNILPPLITVKEKEILEQEPSEFQIDETFHIPNVGIVVGGLLTCGVIKESCSLYLGPSNLGEFYLVQISSIHQNKVPCQSVKAGNRATLGLKFEDKKFKLVRKGMVLITEMSTREACFFFKATIYVLFHHHIIKSGFQVTVHINNICQTAVIQAIMAKELKTNQTSSVLFKFLKYPEYVKIGARILFRQGRSQGFGKITQTFPIR